MIDFVTCLAILTNWKEDNYDSNLVIIDWLTKIVYYKLVKVIINIPELAEVIINVIVYYHNLLVSIVTDKGSLFISKFWSLLNYFFGIKRRLFTVFYP